MAQNEPLVSVVFPCLNERESIGTCVKRARKALEDAGLDGEVIVSDNASTDGSADEAQVAGARIVNAPRRGYGYAVCAGVDASRGDVVVISDADGTYPLEEIPAFAGAARAADGIVLGSRFAGTILPGSMPALHRLVGSPLTRLLLRVLLGVRCSDPHSGMRAMRRSLFDVVRPIVGGWEFTFEMLVNASRRGVPVKEIPITFSERVGTSKLRALPEGWSFLRFMVLHSPTYLFVVPGAAAMGIGASVLGWLTLADRVVGRANLGINTLVVGAMATIVGYQVVALGVCGRSYMNAMHASTRRRWFTLERGIVVGAMLLLGGVGLVASVGARWLASDFGELPRSDHGFAIVGLTTAVIGMQTIFSSFFLSLLVGERREQT